MPFVQARCTNCGATLKVDSDHEAAVCPSCGCAFIVEKAINHYHTTVNNTYQQNFAGATIHIDQSVNVDNLFALGMDSYQGGRYKEAYNSFTKVLEVKADHPLAMIYRGLSVAKTAVFTQQGYDINFAMMINAVDRIIHTESLLEILGLENLRACVDEMLAILSTAIREINLCYVPRALGQDNITVVWGALGICLSSCTDLGRAMYDLPLNALQPGSPLWEQTYQIGMLTLAVLDTMTAEREYSVVWGTRSGIGQINRVRPNNYGQLIAYRRDIAAELYRQFPDRRMPSEASMAGGLIPQTSGKNGCYVATCVYGSYDCPEVWVLRRYRDQKLAKTRRGRLFIRLYYAVSPTLVKWFGKTGWFRAMWRGKLNRMVKKYKAEGYEDTPYDDPAYGRPNHPAE